VRANLEELATVSIPKRRNVREGSGKHLDLSMKTRIPLSMGEGKLQDEDKARITQAMMRGP